MATKKTKKKSTVNKAGNYTKPTMRKNLFNKIKAGSKGAHVRLRCWLNSIRLKEVDTSNGT
jgi:hypothetical protein